MIKKGMLCTYRAVTKKSSAGNGSLYKVLAEPDLNTGKAAVGRIGTAQKFGAELTKLRPLWVQPADSVIVTDNPATVVTEISHNKAACSDGHSFFVGGGDANLVSFPVVVRRRGTSY